jgi:predicted nucleic acid-binding protein
MKFWDNSALVPLLVNESTSKGALRELERDLDVLVWWGTEVECASALCRLERDGGLDEHGLDEAIARLNDLAPSWQVIQPTSRIRAVAVRLLRLHPLRSADALQLAAALEASESEPRTLPFVTLDERLARSASREGFPIVDLGVA